MPLSAAARSLALGSALDDLITLQAAQITEWVAAGRPPSFSIEGESYSWGSWLAELDAAITAKLEQINKVAGPFIVRSRGRV